MKSIAFVSVKKAFSVFLAFLLLFSACFVVAPVFSSAITADNSHTIKYVSHTVNKNDNTTINGVTVSGSTTDDKINVSIVVSAKSDSNGLFYAGKKYDWKVTVSYTVQGKSYTTVVSRSGTASGAGDANHNISKTETVTITRTLSGVKLSGSPLKADFSKNSAKAAGDTWLL